MCLSFLRADLLINKIEVDGFGQAFRFQVGDEGQQGVFEIRAWGQIAVHAGGVIYVYVIAVFLVVRWIGGMGSGMIAMNKPLSTAVAIAGRVKKDQAG